MSLIIRSFSFSNRKEQSLNRKTHSVLQLSYAYHFSLSPRYGDISLSVNLARKFFEGYDECVYI